MRVVFRFSVYFGLFFAMNMVTDTNIKANIVLLIAILYEQFKEDE